MSAFAWRDVSSSRSRTKRNSWRLLPEGARLAANRIVARSASGIGSGRNRRMARVVAMASRTSMSVAGDLRRPLLQEGGHTFLEVLTAEQRQQLQEDVVHVLLERLGLGHAHHSFRGAHRQRRIGS